MIGEGVEVKRAARCDTEESMCERWLRFQVVTLSVCSYRIDLYAFMFLMDRAEARVSASVPCVLNLEV